MLYFGRCCVPYRDCGNASFVGAKIYLNPKERNSIKYKLDTFSAVYCWLCRKKDPLFCNLVIREFAGDGKALKKKPCLNV